MSSIACLLFVCLLFSVKSAYCFDRYSKYVNCRYETVHSEQQGPAFSLLPGQPMETVARPQPGKVLDRVLLLGL